MAWDLWTSPFDQDEIEEDSKNEKDCVKVLRYLITTADSEIENLEKNLVSLQNELAWTEHENWPEICCSALTERINRLEVGVTTLKSGHADDAELQLLLDNGPAERLHEIVKALYKDQFQDAHGQDLLAISLVRSPDLGVVSCVPYHSDRMILSDTLDDKVTGDEGVRQSQLVATDTCQILNPILSKEENTTLKENVCSDDHRLAIIKLSQQIASETKELNITVNGNVCSDDDRLAIIKSQHIASETKVKKPFLSKGNKNIPSETKEVNITVNENVCSDDDRLAIIKSQHILSETKVKKPFLSKGNKNIPSETKEVNITVIENVCSDDDRLAIIKSQHIASETKVKKPFLSKGNKNIPSETKEVNISVNENVCSDDDRLAIIKSQIIAINTGQILNPFSSKGNGNIASDAKEENTNLKENVCSDDHRLAIVKEMELYPHSDLAQKLCDFVPKTVRRAYRKESKVAPYEDLESMCNIIPKSARRACRKESKVAPDEDLESMSVPLQIVYPQKLCLADTESSAFKEKNGNNARQVIKLDKATLDAENSALISMPGMQTKNALCTRLQLTDVEEPQVQDLKSKIAVNFSKSNKRFPLKLKAQGKKKPEFEACFARETLPLEVIPSTSKNVSTKRQRKPKTCTAGTILNEPMNGQNTKRAVQPGQHEIEGNAIVLYDSDNESTKRQRKPKPGPAGTILNEPMNGQNTKRAVQPGQHEIEGNAIVLYDSDNASTKRQRRPKPCPAGTLLNDPMNGQNTKRVVQPDQHEIEGNAIVLYDSDNVSTKRQRKSKPCPAGTILNDPMNSKSNKRALKPGEHRIDGNAVVLYDSKFSELQKKRQVPELSLALVDSHNDSLALVPMETMQTLMKKKVAELKSDAKKLNIKGFSKLLKADLAEKIFQRLGSL